MRRLFFKDVLIALSPLLALVLGLVLVYGLIFGFPRPTLWNRNNAVEAQFMISQEKLTHAIQFRFLFRFVKDEGPIIVGSFDAFTIVNPRSENFDPFYNELVFVHSPEDAEGFAHNVIVAWPETVWIESIIDGIHEALNKDNPLSNVLSEYEEKIELENFGLLYPLTKKDFIDNWESVLNLWLSLPVDDLVDIRRKAVNATNEISS